VPPSSGFLEGRDLVQLSSWVKYSVIVYQEVTRKSEDNCEIHVARKSVTWLIKCTLKYVRSFFITY
jgi:hypothetical protein